MTVLLQDWEPTYLGRFRSALTSPYFIHRFCDKESNIYSIVLFSFNHMPLIRDLVLYYYLTSQLFSFLICSEVQCSDILGNFSEWVSLWVNELVNGREKGLLIDMLKICKLRPQFAILKSYLELNALLASSPRSCNLCLAEARSASWLKLFAYLPFVGSGTAIILSNHLSVGWFVICLLLFFKGAGTYQSTC